MKEIQLKDLKTILYDGIVLREWNDNAEDFDVLYQVVDFLNPDIPVPDELWDRKVCAMTSYSECGIDYIVIEL